MPEYQNIFTQLQVQGPVEAGAMHPGAEEARFGAPRLSTWMRAIGNARLGPIHLGALRVVSIITGTPAIDIMSFSMPGQVGWSIPEFLRTGLWLALEPPSPECGLSMPPLQDGGRYIISGFFLLVAVMARWLRTYRRALDLGMGTHAARAFGSAIWLLLVLGPFRPPLMGSWSEGAPYGIFAHLD